LTLVPPEPILRAEIKLTYVIIYRFALIKCDTGKPDVDILTRINGLLILQSFDWLADFHLELQQFQMESCQPVVRNMNF
jgi:hypothetical protein